MEENNVLAISCDVIVQIGICILMYFGWVLESLRILHLVVTIVEVLGPADRSSSQGTSAFSSRTIAWKSSSPETFVWNLKRVERFNAWPVVGPSASAKL